MLVTNDKVNKSEQPTLLHDIGYLMIKIIAIIGVFILLFTFLFGVNRTTDHSMSPAIKDGDLVVFYRMDKHYVANDLVMLNYDGEKQTRRVIAVAGDTVDISEEGLMINNSLQQEYEIYTKTQRFEGGIDFPITLKENEIFVLGDNRENALDSRMYGPIKVNDTLGKIITVIRRRNL